MRFKHWRWLLNIGIALISLWPQAYGFYRAEVHWHELHQRGTLRVGIDPSTQPFSFYDPSGWVGFEADLGRELAARLNLRLVSTPVGYDALYDALKLDRVDIILSSVIADPMQNNDVRYSTPYFDAGLRLVMPRSRCCPPDNASVFAQQRVAVALGSEADRILRYWQRRTLGVQRVAVADDMAALAALRQGQADVAVLDALTPPDLMRNADLDFRVLTPQPYVIGVQREHTHLLNAINRTLDAMRRDGTLAALATKWRLEVSRGTVRQ